MLFVFGTIIILASVILGVIILIQNPKGGGLTSSFGGFGNQLMGVKQTTDILEKGTWIFAGIIGVLCITSAMFIPKTGGTN
jgi:preprotein translocase subunit SecG